jgi:hypothetical protein
VIFGTSVGVRLVDLATGVSNEVVKPDELPLGDPIERSDITWSPSGETVVSPVCDANTCEVAVIDVADGSATVFPGFVPRAASDSYLVGYRAEDDRGWAALDLTSGAVVSMTSRAAAPYDAIAVSETEFLIYGAETASSGVLHYALHDLESRPERLLATDSTGESRLYDLLRSSGWALVGGPDGIDGALRGQQRWDLLRLADGSRFVGAVPISSTIRAPGP